jgi:aerobic-type carbon monoxide dehydrogenase small subunit (CoxS/CutS family)
MHEGLSAKGSAFLDHLPFVQPSSEQTATQQCAICTASQARHLVKLRQQNEDMTMRSIDSRTLQNTTRRLWELFITARTYQARQLLKTRSN